MEIAPRMLDQISHHSAPVKEETGGFREWRLAEDKIVPVAVQGQQGQGGVTPALQDCLQVGLTLDTERIHGRVRQQRAMMITLDETLIGAEGKDTCTADVLCVIDVSGSMSGEKINNVKTTLKYLVHILNGSRLALVAFSSKSETRMHFKEVNEANSPKIMQVIESLAAGGGTNITAAVHNAQTLLASRATRNQVCSVFFLSDGQHNEGPISQDLMFGKDYEVAKTEYTLHCFGYGDDHDATLMQGMAERKAGNYYFVHDIIRVDECFVDCLGTVTTALAESGAIRVTLLPSSSGSKFKVLQTHGAHIKKLEDNLVEAEMLTIYAGLHKDFMFDVEFVPGEHSQPGQPEIIQARIDFEFNKLGAQQLTKTSKMVQFEVVAGGEHQTHTVQVSNSVGKNVLRVKAVDILKTVKSLQEGKQKEIAITLLTGFESELSRDPQLASDPLVKSISDVIAATKHMFRESLENRQGQFKIDNYLMQQINIFGNQASAPLFEQTGLFATAKQKGNLANLKEK